MQDLFHAAPLLPDEARLAYPLVQMFDPAVTLRDWLVFARRLQRKRPEQAGLMAVRDARGTIFALFSYVVEHDFRKRACLRVSDLIVGYLPSTVVNEVILLSAQKLADRFACGSLLIDVPVPPNQKAALPGFEGLANSSFVPSAVTFQRRLA